MMDCIVVLRPCSEDMGDFNSWLQYLAESGSAAAVQAIKDRNDGQWIEWVTSTSPRPGVDGLRRPSADGHGQPAGGITRLVVRRGWVSHRSWFSVFEPLRPNNAGSFNGLAILIHGAIRLDARQFPEGRILK